MGDLSSSASEGRNNVGQTGGLRGHLDAVIRKHRTWEVRREKQQLRTSRLQVCRTVSRLKVTRCISDQRETIVYVVNVYDLNFKQ
jgi:hypothetical protein